MDNLLVVARQVGILFALMAFGVASRRARLLNDETVKGVVNVLIILVTPCLIVDAFGCPYAPERLAGLGVAFLFAVATHLVLIALGRVAFRRSAPNTRAVLRVATVFSNAGFMGIPLEQAILGDAGVFYGTVFIVVFNLFMWSWGLGVMRAGAPASDGDDGRLRLLVNPGTVGLALGLAVFLSPWKLPAPVREPIALMAKMNTPLAMVVIGYYLAGARFSVAVRSPLAHLSAVLRLVLAPLAVLAVLYPLRTVLDRDLMLAIVIPVAAPVGAMVTMFAARYGRDVDMSVALVSGTTLLSVATMPPVIALAMSLLS